MSLEERPARLDPVVAAYLEDVDRTLLRENLRLSHEDRIRKLQAAVLLRRASKSGPPGKRGKETNFEGLIHRLAQGRVDFILVGGVAAILHGSARVTFDIDAIYSRSVSTSRGS